jgi:hypothetical protein
MASVFPGVEKSYYVQICENSTKFFGRYSFAAPVLGAILAGTELFPHSFSETAIEKTAT